jgi:hypothetical protein
MPPNQIGGTGKKRGMKQGNVPPVHRMDSMFFGHLLFLILSINKGLRRAKHNRTAAC